MGPATWRWSRQGALDRVSRSDVRSSPASNNSYSNGSTPSLMQERRFFVLLVRARNPNAVIATSTQS